VDRRAFIASGSMASLGLAMGGCAPRTTRPPIPTPPRLQLAPADVSWDRIIRTTVGLRPARDSGFRLEAERLDAHTVIHNYGHGGAGMSLSWGTAQLAAEIALAHTDRRAAVIGCGIVGLTSARQLQRRGFEVTIYAASLPPDTTSNMSLATFTPVSGLVVTDRRTPEWDATFGRAVEIAYREHQLLVGRGYGVTWIDEYTLAGSPGGGGTPPANRLLPGSVELGQVVFGPGEHPFPTLYARRRPTLRFEPSIYLEALMRDVLTFGGRIVVRSFDTPRDLVSLTEPLVVNCTGLGARRLVGDDELVPVKGQLVVLVPQPEVTYTTGSMLPRSDGIVLGHVMQRGESSLTVDEDERRRVVEAHMRTFGAMALPSGATGPVSATESPFPPSFPPPVESFFHAES
jgi:D-amino-acid oxidase